jgi:hypothetical protein
MVSLANLRQRVVKVHFPPPLDVTWWTQGPHNSAEQHLISRGSSSWWFISSRNLESTRSTKTTVNTTITNWFRGTCKESITTLYYWLYTMFIMQSTGPRNIHNLLFFSSALLFFEPAWFTCNENPPSKCAEITRQNNPPGKSAVATCRIYVRL